MAKVILTENEFNEYINTILNEEVDEFAGLLKKGLRAGKNFLAKKGLPTNTNELGGAMNKIANKYSGKIKNSKYGNTKLGKFAKKKVDGINRSNGRYMSNNQIGQNTLSKAKKVGAVGLIGAGVLANRNNDNQVTYNESEFKNYLTQLITEELEEVRNFSNPNVLRRKIFRNLKKHDWDRVRELLASDSNIQLSKDNLSGQQAGPWWQELYQAEQLTLPKNYQTLSFDQLFNNFCQNVDGGQTTQVRQLPSEQQQQVQQQQVQQQQAQQQANNQAFNALVLATIQGKYGNGQQRKQALGSNYQYVQARCNEIYRQSGNRWPQVNDPIYQQGVAPQGFQNPNAATNTNTTQANTNTNAAQANANTERKTANKTIIKQVNLNGAQNSKRAARKNARINARNARGNSNLKQPKTTTPTTTNKPTDRDIFTNDDMTD